MTDQEKDRRSRHDHAREVFERLGLNPRLPLDCAVWEKGRLSVEHVHTGERFTYYTETDRWTPDGEKVYSCEGPEDFARRHAGAGTWYVIGGETYPVRDVLRRHGLTWDPDREEWGTNDEAAFREVAREVGASFCGEQEAVREGTTEAEGEPLIVSGNTWSARHALQAVGMNWEPDAEVYWTRDRDVWERVREAVPVEQTGERELTVNEDLAPWNVDERINWSRLPTDPPES
jgi:hypothetical protein